MLTDMNANITKKIRSKNMASKYNAEGYYSPTEYEAFTRVEKKKGRQKEPPTFDRLFTYAHLIQAM